MTLLEVLIALGLCTMLMGTMLWFGWDVVRARGRAVEAARNSAAVTALFDRLETDLVFAVRRDPRRGSGLVGDADRLVVLSRAVLPGERGPSAVLGDLQRQEIRFDPATRRVLGGRGPAGGGVSLTAADAEVHLLRFRYYDGTEWLESYDSGTAGALPTAIEVAVWLRPLPPGFAPEVEDPMADDRLTFDPGEIIDAEAAAGASERLMEEEPAPDRIRVISVPDAGEPDDASNDAFDPESDLSSTPVDDGAGP